MIEIDISSALKLPGEWFDFIWEGFPGYEQLELDGPMTVKCEFGLFGHAIRVRGRLHAVLELECSRCLDDVRRDVDSDFDELFMENPGDLDAYAYNREQKRISLDQMIYDILSMDIPLQVLCSDTCKGLCPQCGQNLNDKPCACVSDKGHAISQNNPFAVLKDLF